jgi:glycosyltransferase involved in cell wall biosynthesis
MTKSIGIIHFAAPPIIGGVESTIYHHARLLVTVGFKVTVIAGRGEPFHSQVDLINIPEIDSRHPTIQQVSKELTQEEVPVQFNLLRDHIIEQLYPILANTDVCIVHNAITLHKNLPLTAALRKLSDLSDINLIAWCHDFAWQDPLYAADLNPAYPWDLLKTVWPGVRYVTVSEHRRLRLATMLNIPPDSIKVIHPGVDPTEFFKFEPTTQRLIEDLNLLEATPLLLLPARITRRKNIEFSLRVTAELKHHYPNVTLVITGPPGPHNPKNVAYLDSLNQLSKELDITSAVHFLYEYGEDQQPLYISDQVISDFYQLADILLFPSRREGFGIPVLEAGLARIPVFAADIPSVQESAGEFAHLFDPEGDPEIVAQAIIESLESNQTFQFRKRVIHNFTWKAVLEQELVPLLEEYC